MNIGEGFRRIGLLLGILGAIAGFAASCVTLGEAIRHRSENARFQNFAQKYWQVMKAEKMRRGGVRSSSDAKLSSDQFWDQAAELYQHEKQALSTEGLAEIRLNGDNIESIKCTDGATLFPSPVSIWSWLLPLTFPVAGFFFHWGLIRIFVWIISGFAQSPA
jgi:hypothetical protein